MGVIGGKGKKEKGKREGKENNSENHRKQD